MRLENAFGVLLLLLLPISDLLAQVHTEAQNASTFTDRDSAFKFEYPSSMVLCNRDPKQSDLWIPPESCAAYTPVCSAYSGDADSTVACVAYLAGGLKSKTNFTNFEAAAFSVNELKQVRNEDECFRMKGTPFYGTAHNETINGAKFKVVETSSAGLGHILQGYVYRSFHHECYELALRIAWSNIGNWDPGTVKSFDFDMVHRSLVQVLNSFEFLK